MNMNHALDLLNQIDELNQKILDIEKQKVKIFTMLNEYKKQIEKQHSYLIGKKAMCVHVNNPNPIECICTSVIALDDYKSVKPLFSRNGKKYIIETFEWI